MWQGILGTVTRVAREHDREWLRRQRLINTLLVVLFVYRLVFADDDRGYGVTLNKLWEQCRRLGVTLPQPQPVAAPSMCAARAKVDETVFRTIHRAVLAEAREPLAARPWRGHRAFAVDGSKLNLPRELRRAGYQLPTPKAHYPQGLLSCLYQLGTNIPVDCDLVAHNNERRAALTHLPALQPGDVVVYDRGYYSFAMLPAHAVRGLHAVFRLKSNANALFAAFIAGRRQEALVTVEPSDRAREQCPPAALRPRRVRLVKYTAGGTTFSLATTLLDRRRYPARALAELYHGRWAIEEMYKVTKNRLKVEQFHGRGERTVKQEVYASCTLIALTRLFTNRCEEGFRSAPGEHGKPRMQANVKNGLAVVAEHLEGLLMQQAETVGRTVRSIVNYIGRCRQRVRPGRQYERRSRQQVAVPQEQEVQPEQEEQQGRPKCGLKPENPAPDTEIPPCHINELVSGTKRMPLLPQRTVTEETRSLRSRPSSFDHAIRDNGSLTCSRMKRHWKSIASSPLLPACRTSRACRARCSTSLVFRMTRPTSNHTADPPLSSGRI